jgi:uncharacterized protein YnzC (UPF0291/DUF896 family)
VLASRQRSQIDWLRFEHPEAAQARIEDLARKSAEGTLSDSESQEYEALVSAGTFIAILQSHARRLLKDRPA